MVAEIDYINYTMVNNETPEILKTFIYMNS